MTAQPCCFEVLQGWRTTKSLQSYFSDARRQCRLHSSGVASLGCRQRGARTGSWAPGRIISISHHIHTYRFVYTHLSLCARMHFAQFLKCSAYSLRYARQRQRGIITCTYFHSVPPRISRAIRDHFTPVDTLAV